MNSHVSAQRVEAACNFPGEHPGLCSCCLCPIVLCRSHVRSILEFLLERFQSTLSLFSCFMVRGSGSITGGEAGELTELLMVNGEKHPQALEGHCVSLCSCVHCDSGENYQRTRIKGPFGRFLVGTCE